MKKKLRKFAPWLVLILPLLFIFKNWFSFSLIAAGDAPFYFQTNLEEFSFIPSLWGAEGLGRLSSLLFAFPFLNFPLKALAPFHLPWEVIERLVWYWPLIILGAFSSWYFGKTVLPQTKLWFLPPLLYLLNTYFLMIIGGGQISIALAYALFPLTIALFIKNLGKQGSRQQVIAGLVFALQVAFDPRIAGLALLVAGAYALKEFRLSLLKYLKTFLIPLLIAIGVHFYWLLPLLLLGRGSYVASYAAPGWVEFLSFADFSNSFALLHPNWPENIFGKTYFMKPEFLVIPILAFSALLFLKKQKTQVKKNLLFLTSVALAGAFLAKGANPPLGRVYQGLFHYLPGMNLFRDASKFYVLIALSYSVLIPFSLEQIVKHFKRIAPFKYWFLALFVVYWLFLIRPAWMGQLGGTFQAKEIPADYLVFKEFLKHQKDFSRTLWIPWRPKFGFYSQQHPAINSEDLPPEEGLVPQGVKYVIIPFDSEGEIFLEDRKYDPQQRLALEERLDKVSWLRKVEVADEITVYQTTTHQDHFFVANGEAISLNWEMMRPTQYSVRIEKNEGPITLVFSETFDPLWQVKVGERVIESKNYQGLNNFFLDEAGDLDFTVEFVGQKYVYWGGGVTIITLILVGGLIFLFRKRKA